MKARIPAAVPETALLYGFEPNKLEELRKLIDRLQIRCLVVEEDQRGESIGALAGYPGYTAGAGPKLPAPQAECLVLAGLSRPRLNELLGELRGGGLQVALKAVVTDTNRDWPLEALIRELRREHAAMTEKPPEAAR